MTAPVSDDQPVVGRVVATPKYRVGSPFAPPSPSSGDGESPALAVQWTMPEDLGVAAETARGAVLAAALLVPWAAVACYWFPLGGFMIAGLGTALGMFGLVMRRPRSSAVVLVVHASLFVAAYWRFL